MQVNPPCSCYAGKSRRSRDRGNSILACAGHQPLRGGGRRYSGPVPHLTMSAIEGEPPTLYTRAESHSSTEGRRADDGGQGEGEDQGVRRLVDLHRPQGAQEGRQGRVGIRRSLGGYEQNR